MRRTVNPIRKARLFKSISTHHIPGGRSVSGKPHKLRLSEFNSHAPEPGGLSIEALLLLCKQGKRERYPQPPPLCFLSSVGRASVLQTEGHRFKPYRKHHLFADLAQLAEQLICNQQVVGSSPIVGTILRRGSEVEQNICLLSRRSTVQIGSKTPFADVVQWQNATLPRSTRGFNSLHLLQ